MVDPLVTATADVLVDPALPVEQLLEGGVARAGVTTTARVHGSGTAVALLADPLGPTRVAVKRAVDDRIERVQPATPLGHRYHQPEFENRLTRANNPAIGYNLTPRWQGSIAVGPSSQPV